MEETLVVNSSQSQNWPHGVSSLMNPLTVASSLPKTSNTLEEQVSDNLFLGPASSSLDTLASYWTRELLGCLVSTSTYTPLEIVEIVGRRGIVTMSKLHPHLRTIILTGLACYTIYTVIEAMLLEYQAFLELGSGGTPKLPASWMNLMLMAFFAQVDVHSPPHFDPATQPCTGRLGKLRPRPGKRPTVKGIAPQRQLDETKSPEETFSRLLKMIQNMADKDKDCQVGTSYLEGRTEALMGIFPHRPQKCCDTDGEWNFEIAHPHKIDGSLHMVMHPQDICSVIENGWGERHRLATNSWWWKMFFHRVLGKRRPTPYNLVLIYAPRDESEFEIVQQMLDAAVTYHKELDAYRTRELGSKACHECS